MWTKEKQRVYNQTHYRKNREKLIANAKAWNLLNRHPFPLVIREANLRRKYDLSLEQFDQMFSEQDNKCKICGVAEHGSRGWHLDHCHKTGKIRGILCGNCNSAAGYAGDNPAKLRLIAAYLEESSHDQP